MAAGQRGNVKQVNWTLTTTRRDAIRSSGGLRPLQGIGDGRPRDVETAPGNGERRPAPIAVTAF